MSSSWLTKLTQQLANLIRKECVPWCQYAFIYNCVYEKHTFPSVLGQSPSARQITWVIPVLWPHITRKIYFKLFLEHFWLWLQLQVLRFCFSGKWPQLLCSFLNVCVVFKITCVVISLADSYPNSHFLKIASRRRLRAPH